MFANKEQIRKITDNIRLQESRVGVFYYVLKNVLSDDVPVRDGDPYGDFVNYSSHWDLWKELQKTYKSFQRMEYNTFPRGRVVFNKKSYKYIIYLDKKLNTPEIISKIVEQYKLSSGSYIVNDEDEHYKSVLGV